MKIMKMELTPADNQDIKDIVEVFKSSYHGIGKATKTENLMRHLFNLGKHHISPQKFRFMLGEIRKHDLLAPGFICSDVHLGYWYSTDAEEINAFLHKQLNRMANQYDNIGALHKRIRLTGTKIENPQTYIVF